MVPELELTKNVQSYVKTVRDPFIDMASLNPIGVRLHLNKYAATCDFQQCGIFTSVDSDEPMRSPVKLRNSK